MSNIENCVLEKLNYDSQGNLTPFDTPVTAQIGEFGTIILNLKPSNPSEIKVFPNAKNGLYNANVQEYRYVEGNPLVGQFTYNGNTSALVFNVSERGNHVIAYINAIGKTFVSDVNVATEYDPSNQVTKTLRDTLVGFKRNIGLYNDRDSRGYGFDLANLAGQGLYPKGSPENNNFRAMVIHNYVDTEVLTLDNVGEMPTIFIRNARNKYRRTDKPSNFIPKSNYLQFQQGFMNFDEQGNELDTHTFVTMFNMDYLGNLYWRNNRDDVQTVKFQTVSQPLTNKFAFQIGSYYDTRFIADFQYSNNKSALKIAMDTTGRTQLMTALNGLRLTANKGNMLFECNEVGQSIMFQANGGVNIRRGDTNYPIAHMSSLGVQPPTNENSEGIRGQIHCDNTGLYVCNYDNHWVKFAPTSF